MSKRRPTVRILHIVSRVLGRALYGLAARASGNTKTRLLLWSWPQLSAEARGVGTITNHAFSDHTKQGSEERPNKLQPKRVIHKLPITKRKVSHRTGEGVVGLYLPLAVARLYAVIRRRRYRMVADVAAGMAGRQRQRSALADSAAMP